MVLRFMAWPGRNLLSDQLVVIPVFCIQAISRANRSLAAMSLDTRLMARDQRRQRDSRFTMAMIQPLASARRDEDSAPSAPPKRRNAKRRHPGTRHGAALEVPLGHGRLLKVVPADVRGRGEARQPQLRLPHLHGAERRERIW